MTTVPITAGMRLRRVLACIGVASTAAILLAGCGKAEESASPTGPSLLDLSPRPLFDAPAPDAPVRYAAIGASDANGVGGSVACAPLIPCDNGTGYVPLLARMLRESREVTLVNLGIPASVLSPAIHRIAREQGRNVPGNFVDHELPLVPPDATLVTIFGGANDTNTVANAIERGAAGADVRGYIDTQIRAFAADYDRLIGGIRARAPEAFIIVLNVPNLAGLPYAAGYSEARKQVLQAISVSFSREANRQADSGAVVLDLMCDPVPYEPGRISSDGFHPNDAGYAYFAERLAAIVNGEVPPVAPSCGQMNLVPDLPAR